MYLSFIAKKAKYIIFSFLLCCSFFQIASAQDEYVEGEVFVYFQDCDALGQTFEDAMSILEGASSYTRLKAYPHLNLTLYRQPSPSEDINKHSETGCVEWVGRNHYRTAQAFSMPEDPQIAQQWALNNRGEEINGTPGTFDADIDWFEARKIFSSTEEVVIAVADSGVEVNHPEMQGILWNNISEIQNGSDDDANGYIDDLMGWDFVDNDNTPYDTSGHGTMVASIIAGVTGNGKDGVGVVPDVIKVMPLRVADNAGNTTVADFINSTNYAVDNGARIINYSFAGATANLAEELQVNWLYSQGMLLVTSAGNGSDSTPDNIDTQPVYPVSYSSESVIAVAASDQNDQLASYSNYGFVSVDLAAPGHNIFGADIDRVIAIEEDFNDKEAFETQDWLLANPELVTGHAWKHVIIKDGGGLADSISQEGEDIDYTNLSDSWVASPEIVLAGSRPILTLHVGHNLATFDILSIEVSTAADELSTPVGWIYGVSSEVGAVYRFDLSAFEGETVRIVFKLLSDDVHTAVGVFINYMQIYYLSEPFVDDGNEYAYGYGTSFAAPYVSGVAAMLLSQMIALDNAGGTETEEEKRARLLGELRAYILDNVDPISEMKFFMDSGGRLNAYKAMCAITSCQPFAVSFDLENSDIAVSEEDGIANLVVSREGPADETLMVGVEMEVEGATEDEDFTFTLTEIEFAEGEINKTIPVTLHNDETEENSEEKIHFKLTQPEYGDVGAADTATMTIEPSDPFHPPVVRFEKIEESLFEDVGQVTVNVTRSDELRRVSKVSYAIDGDLERTVYVSGVLEFAPDEQTKSINIYVRDDEVKTKDETFILRLYQPDTAVLEEGNSVELQVTIIDDDTESQNGSGGGGGGGSSGDDETTGGGGGVFYSLLLLSMLFSGVKLHQRKWRPGHDSNV